MQRLLCAEVNEQHALHLMLLLPHLEAEESNTVRRMLKLRSAMSAWCNNMAEMISLQQRWRELLGSCM